MNAARVALQEIRWTQTSSLLGVAGEAINKSFRIGSMLIPAMEKQGYSKKFAAAITAASSVIGPIIPPSENASKNKEQTSFI